MNRTGRLPRIHIPNTVHHVMIRGNNRQVIFLNETCFNRFLTIITESAKKFDHKILCFCLMNNHAHLLIHIHNDSLSKVMQNINHRYARWFNHKYKRIGHLLQGRYRSIAVNDEHYLINLCRYIHFNPVEAKIVQDLADYAWSSHHYYLSETPPKWMDINFLLSAIHYITALNYRHFITHPVDREKWKPGLYISLNGELIIDQDIVKALYPALNQIGEIEKQKLVTPELVLKIISHCLNIQFEKMIERSVNRNISQGRAILVNVWITYSNLTMTEIAKRLNRTRGTLERQQKRFCKNITTCFPSSLLTKIKHILDLAKKLQ